MTRFTVIDIMEILGLASFVVGVSLEFGTPFGMITLGIVLLGYAIVSRRAGVGK